MITPAKRAWLEYMWNEGGADYVNQNYPEDRVLDNDEICNILKEKLDNGDWKELQYHFDGLDMNSKYYHLNGNGWLEACSEQGMEFSDIDLENFADWLSDQGIEFEDGLE